MRFARALVPFYLLAGGHAGGAGQASGHGHLHRRPHGHTLLQGPRAQALGLAHPLTLRRAHAAIVGDVLIIASCVAWAVWFILQIRMAEGFSAPYTRTAIMCPMADH
ncbi:hypothetical protein U9M48_032766 [Paspalum notatum var. saurae]|uniref:Uncharacterized protein n=1 Tax=Paspalum notatum var. saurae TaxID=547442 RepID=A0AAQ3U5S1_PASNO